MQDVNYNIRLVAEDPDTIDANGKEFKLRVIWPEMKIEFVVPSSMDGEIHQLDWLKTVHENHISPEQEAELWKRLGVSGFFSFPV
jgi:hypothetical protein